MTTANIPKTQMITSLRCACCGTEFEDLSGSGKVSCINCKHEIPRAIARSDKRVHYPKTAFTYQDIHHPELIRFREKYKLDEVVVGARSELEAHTALRDWTFRQFRDAKPDHWNMDAEAIIDAGREGMGFHCTFFAFVTCQAATSLGYIARRLNPGGHMIYDIWNNELDKWVVMDSKANIHWEIGGVPLSDLELREALFTGREREIDAVFGHGAEQHVLTKDRDELIAWAKGYDAKRWSRDGISWGKQMAAMTFVDDKHKFARVYAASDYFSRPLNQYNHVKTHRVYLWSDEHNAGEKQEVTAKDGSKHEAYVVENIADRVSDPLDYEWPMNRTEFQIVPDAGDELKVYVWTLTPNFSHFEVRHGEGERWQRMKLEIDTEDPMDCPCWRWAPEGEGEIQIRSVNLSGRAGVVACAKVG